MSAREIIRKKVSELTHGPNIRSDLGTEEELRTLGASLGKGQDTPLLIVPDDTVVDGHRRLAAARLVGIEALDCIVVPPGTTPGECRLIQWRCAVHKKDVSATDKAVVVRGTKDDHPAMTNRQLAELLDIDPALVTKYLALFDCHQDVIQAAKEGLIGLTDWYAISKSLDQGKALAMALNGSSRADLERESRRQRNDNGQIAVRLPKLKIPIANDAASGVVTLSGDGLDLEAAEALLKEAARAVKAARDKGLDPKTAQAVWRDVAKAS
jgi:ParB family transcriptional regulator, chromosome partitioning protein